MKRGTALIVFGLALIAAACLLMGWNMYSEAKAGEEAGTLLGEYLNSVDLNVHVDASTGDMPALSVDGYPVSGTISLPAIDITLPVLATWSYPMLKITACTYSGTAQDGGLIILAHNFSTHFGHLKEMAVGDSVYFTDVNGVKYSYEVTQLETLGKYDLDELTNGNWDLTLFTCTYGGQNRVVVRCTKV